MDFTISYVSEQSAKNLGKNCLLFLLQAACMLQGSPVPSATIRSHKIARSWKSLLLAHERGLASRSSNQFRLRSILGIFSK